MKILIASIFFIVQTFNLFSQDSLTTISKKSTKKRFPFEIEIGATRKSQNKNQSLADNLTHFYSYSSDFTYSITNYVGFHSCLSVPIKINSYLDIVPSINYDYMTSKIDFKGQYDFYTEGSEIHFNGYGWVKKNQNLVGVSVGLRFNPVDELIIENYIGINDLVKQTRTGNQFNNLDNTVFEKQSSIKDFFFIPYTAHKIGAELIKSRVFLIGGITLYYNSFSKRNINSQFGLGLKFRL